MSLFLLLLFMGNVSIVVVPLHGQCLYSCCYSSWAMSLFLLFLFMGNVSILVVTLHGQCLYSCCYSSWAMSLFLSYSSWAMSLFLLLLFMGNVSILVVPLHGQCLYSCCYSSWAMSLFLLLLFMGNVSILVVTLVSKFVFAVSLLLTSLLTLVHLFLLFFLLSCHTFSTRSISTCFFLNDIHYSSQIIRVYPGSEVRYFLLMNYLRDLILF